MVRDLQSFVYVLLGDGHALEYGVCLLVIEWGDEGRCIWPVGSMGCILVHRCLIISFLRVIVV